MSPCFASNGFFAVPLGHCLNPALPIGASKNSLRILSRTGMQTAQSTVLPFIFHRISVTHQRQLHPTSPDPCERSLVSFQFPTRALTEGLDASVCGSNSIARMGADASGCLSHDPPPRPEMEFPRQRCMSKPSVWTRGERLKVVTRYL